MVARMATEASWQTQAQVWWCSIPLATRWVGTLLVGVFALETLFGLNLGLVCFSPAIFKQETIRSGIIRLIASPYIHASILHVLFNTLALLNTGPSLERAHGSLRFLVLVLLIQILAAGLQFGLYLPKLLLFPKHLSSIPMVQSIMNIVATCSVGYSGIIFGLLMMEVKVTNSADRSIFGLFSVPTKYYPFVLMAIIQLLLPGASFIGHVCGLLAGLVLSNTNFASILWISPAKAAFLESRILPKNIYEASMYISAPTTAASEEFILPPSSHLGQTPRDHENGGEKNGIFARLLPRSWISSHDLESQQPAANRSGNGSFVAFSGEGRKLGSSST